MLLYFTSGATTKPKLVQHTYVSYPVDHLSTMHWIGLEPGDVHLNISSQADLGSLSIPPCLGRDHPRRLRSDRDQRPGRQHPWTAGATGIDGPSAPTRPPGAGTATPGTSDPGMRTAASPTSGGPMTCSRPPTTGSRRSSWRACCWSTMRSPRRRWCPRRTRCGCRCPRPMWCSPPVTSPTSARRSPSCGSPGSTSRRTGGCGGWSSPSSQDDLRQDPAGRAARPGERCARRGGARAG